MSWVLGIDTSSVDCSIGLVDKGKPCITCSRYVPNAHAEHINRIVSFVMEINGIEASDITCAGIAVGPGSFTGLRIGISFLKGFFLYRTTPIMPISSLHCLAESFLGPNGTILVAMDARKDTVFCTKFQKIDGSLKRLEEDRHLPFDRFLKIVDSTEMVLLDTLGYTKSTVFDSLKNRANVFFAHTLALQRGLSCATIANRNKTNTSVLKKTVDILPNYMQESYVKNIRKQQ